MIRNIIYAKKIILPSIQANVLQSLNMAAAFASTGAATFFYPGVNLRKAPEQLRTRALPDEKPRGFQNPQNQCFLKDCKRSAERRTAFLSAHLAACKLAAPAHGWQAMPAENKGLYSLLFDMRLAALILRMPNTMLYARDVSEGAIISGLLRLPFFRRQRPVFLYEMHEPLFCQHRDYEKRPNWRATLNLERKILAAADGLVVTNRAIVDLVMSEFAIAAPVHEAPNGINDDVFRPVKLFDGEAGWPGKQDVVRLVYLGNMHPGKGVEECVKAVGLLPRRFRLTIIGGGSEKVLSEINALIDALPDGRERVKMYGHIAPAAIREHCRGAHISIIPQQEGGGYFSPLKLNESLALGLPIVCTPLAVFAGQREYMLSSRDCSPAGIAAAIAALADQPEEAQRLRENGLAIVEQQTWKARAARILAFAEECGGNRRPPTRRRRNLLSPATPSGASQS